MRTHGHREESITHQGLSGVEGKGRDSREWGYWGGIALGEIPNVDDEVINAETTMAHVYLCNKPARSAHVPQNLKYSNK